MPMLFAPYLLHLTVEILEHSTEVPVRAFAQVLSAMQRRQISFISNYSIPVGLSIKTKLYACYEYLVKNPCGGWKGSIYSYHGKV